MTPKPRVDSSFSWRDLLPEPRIGIRSERSCWGTPSLEANSTPCTGASSIHFSIRCHPWVGYSSGQLDAELIDEQAQVMFELAEKHGIDYDGWGTSIGEDDEEEGEE